MFADARSLAGRSALVLAVAVLFLPSSASAWCQMTTSDLRPTPAEPCILVANHAGESPLAWRRRCTSVSLSTVDASMDLSDGDVRDIVTRSLSTWESVVCDGGVSTGLDVELLSETNVVGRARHFANGRNVNAIIFVHSEWDGERGHDPQALAVTYVWHDPATGEIFDADMELNEETIDFVICPESGCPAPVDTHTADLENTLTHEFGHYFGIAHTPDDPAATMWARADPGEALKRTLQPDDVLALCSIYPEGNLPVACSYTPRGGLGLDGVPPSGCACRAGLGRERHARGLTLLGACLIAALALRRRGRK